jgi:hypothetical protein
MADVKGITSELVKGVASPKEIQRSHSLLEPHLPSERVSSPRDAKDTLTKVFKEMNS